MLAIALPLTLAWIMFCVGLNLTLADFSRIFKAPKWIILGLLAQLVALPLLVWALVTIFNIPTPIAIGLYLIAFSPGGNTSNAISALADGDVALSTTLTGFSSLIIPFTFPILLPLFVEDTHLQISPMTAFMQLTLVSIVPMVLGMLVNYKGKQVQWLQNFAQSAPKTSLIALFFVVLITVLNSPNVLPVLLSEAAVYVLLLCVIAMTFGALVAKLFKADGVISRTFAIEVGVQNAGTAIFVAINQLKSPELAMTPLLYGVLMNLPVLLLILYTMKGKADNNIPA